MKSSSVLVLAYAYDRHRGGGSVRIACDIAEGLASRGHEVTVIAEDLFGAGQEVETSEGVRVLRYRIDRERTGLVPRLWAHSRAVRRLVRKYVGRPPTAVHGHNPFQFAAALPLFRGHSRLCFTVHSPTAMEMAIVWRSQGLTGRIKVGVGGLRLIRCRERACLEHADRIMALSEFTRGLIELEYGATSADRVKVIPGWADTERFRPLTTSLRTEARERFGWAPDIPVLVVVRRLEARMGLEALLKALWLVRRSGTKLFTVIAGTGSMREHLTRVAADLGVDDSVAFPGFVSAEDLPKLYGAADLSMIPTDALEGFGLIAVEALACGVPVLVTPVGALPEVVGGIEKSWVAAGRTPEALADILSRYLSGQLPRSTPGCLHQAVVDRFSLSRGIDAYEGELFG